MDLARPLGVMWIWSCLLSTALDTYYIYTYMARRFEFAATKAPQPWSVERMNLLCD